MPEQRVTVYKINSMKKPIKRIKIAATAWSDSQWKLIVNLLSRQQRLADCYPKSITSSYLSKIIAKYQQKVTWRLPNGQSRSRKCMWPEAYDRKCMWQEMRQRNTNWSSEERNLNTNKPQKLPEALQVGQSQ